MATNASLGPDAAPSTEQRSARGRDTCEGAQDDDSDVTQNNPPNHGLPPHGIGRFLWETPKETPVDELGELYRSWRRNDE